MYTYILAYDIYKARVTCLRIYFYIKFGANMFADDLSVVF